MFIVITFNIAKWQNNNKPQIPENLPCAKLPRAPNYSVSNSCSSLGPQVSMKSSLDLHPTLKPMR